MSGDDRALLAAIGVMIALALVFMPAKPPKRVIPPRPSDPLSPIAWRNGQALIDINRADAALLNTLPGIGDKLSGRIVADRAVHGPFQSVDGITRVSGIGAGKLEQIAPRVTVAPE